MSPILDIFFSEKEGMSEAGNGLPALQSRLIVGQEDVLAHVRGEGPSDVVEQVVQAILNAPTDCLSVSKNSGLINVDYALYYVPADSLGEHAMLGQRLNELS